MNTFLKTFFVCLVLTFSFLAYKYFSVDSYNANLAVSKNNPVFGIHEGLPDAPIIEKKAPDKAKNQDKTPQVPVKKDEKFVYKCYFYAPNGSLKLIERKTSIRPTLEGSIAVLLKGPSISESKKGVFSEIPPNVDLIEIKRANNDVIVDLSANFGNGGGTNSISNRVKQLSKTVKLYEPNKNVYLYINGKEVEYLGGDGVYIKQPLE